MVPKELANQSFCAIPHNGAADLAGSGNPESRRRLPRGAGEHRHEPAAYARAGFVCPLKVGPATDVLVGPKRFGTHAPVSSFI
jgi:hypothetical protein